MRPRTILWVVAASGLLAGCADGPPRHSTSWLQRFRQAVEPAGPDIVAVDVFMVECPYGAPYVSWNLWATADEQVVDADVEAQLDDNGFRVGTLGGLLPGELQGLMAGKNTCPDPRRIESHAGKATQLLLGPGMARAEFQLHLQGEEPTTLALDDAQCLLEMTAVPAEGGRVRLKFVPVVEHGAARVQPKPTADRTGWVYAQDRPTERLARLGWELTLRPDEFVAVGGRFDRPGTLGHRAFLRADEPTPVQRLLVVRAGLVGDRSAPDAAGADAAGADLRSPALARQASRSVVRGVAP